MGSLSIWHIAIIFVLVTLLVFWVPRLFRRRPSQVAPSSAQSDYGASAAAPAPAARTPIFEGGFVVWVFKLALSAVVTGLVGLVFNSMGHR
jgi:hypothetical protein